MADPELIGKGKGRIDPVFVTADGFAKSDFLIPAHYRDDLEKVLIPRGLVIDRVERLAVDIRDTYGDVELHALCVLKGSRGFFAELLKVLNRIHRYTKHEHPPFYEHYVRIKSYENTESTGKVNIMCESLHLLEGKDVLIVEDIIDTGTTLTRFCNQLLELKPRSIRVASLVEKRTPKSNGFVADFAGFSVPDEFLVGYCLDYNEVYRDLDHICTLGESGIKKYAK
jgi:hypoxanthine phosphoribosyltransferase